VDLGNGILSALLWTEPVGARVNSASNWLNHQLQRSLNNPVAGGGDPEHSEFSV